MRLLFLERDIDKALCRMTLEEEKNLTETVNEILWKGLKDYLKQTGTNHVLHRKGTVSGFTPLLDKDGKPAVSQSPSSQNKKCASPSNPDLRISATRFADE